MSRLSDSDPYLICSRVNSTTFVIHEKDRFKEHPFIYVKTFQDVPVIVLSDTGCGGPNQRNTHSSNLREFIETSPIDSNDGRPLNPRDFEGKATKRYIIICTHCHYDHILGLPHFGNASPNIVASWEGKAFIKSDLPEHSLCKYLNIPTPKYEVTTWAHNLEDLFYNGVPLHIQIIHTPGHTPDEIAWYDASERHLYVGDSFYERMAADESYEQAIIFPKEGNIEDYLQSLNKLLLFVEQKNNDNDASKGPLRIGCGHVTSSVDGREVILAVRRLFSDILQDKVPIVLTEEKRGETYATWKTDGEARFSVEAPKRIIQDAKHNRGNSLEWYHPHAERHALRIG